MFLAIEAGLAILALVLAFTVPNLGARWFEAVEWSFGRLARRRGLSVIVVGLTALALRAALLPILPIPHPGILDEYGYLLLSDTFAHGLLTNPTNPMWMHFESIFIIWHPTYTAQYWPAQGLIMALGQVLTGQPFWGIWLSAGLMCASITWMLQGWLEPGWALLGGFLAVIRIGSFSYWANSYWGGAVAAIGGALVLGALPRLKKEQRARHALLMGLGLAILANSRPYEGLFFGIPVAVSIAIWLWKIKRPDLRRALKYAMAPLMALIALTLVAMGYYFWRVTGSPFNYPYSAYAHAYHNVNFPWESLKPHPVYRHKVFREYFERFEFPQYKESHSVVGIATIKTIDFLYFWTFFLGPVFTLPLLMAWAVQPYGFTLRDIDRGTRFLMLVGVVTLAGEALALWFYPHYAAPITCVIFALVLVALRSVRLWEWSGKPSGKFITRAVPSICLLLFLLRVSAGFTHWPPIPKWPEGVTPTWCSVSPQNLNRAAMLTKLRQYPGRQLVIVRFGKHHNPFFNAWIYNRADLQSAKVIWAHDMGPAQNEKLIRYFKRRHVWLLYADDQPPRMVLYPEAVDRGSPPIAQREP